MNIKEHKKGAYRSFVMLGKPKTDIDNHLDRAKPHINTIIKNHLKELGSAKIIMTLWIIWKKPIEPLIELNPEDVKKCSGPGYDAITGDGYIRIEMPFNSLMTNFF